MSYCLMSINQTIKNYKLSLLSTSETDRILTKSTCSYYKRVNIFNLTLNEYKVRNILCSDSNLVKFKLNIIKHNRIPNVIFHT